MNKSWRNKLHTIIFEADTKAGKIFDILLIYAILLSVITVMLDSVVSFKESYGVYLYYLEWLFTLLFSLEYLLRLSSIGKPFKYATSFFGIVDLLSVIPTYLSVIFSGAQALIVIRILRVLRIFRVLKLVKYLGEADILLKAIINSRRKITVFMLSVITLVIIFGAIMYLVESQESGFNSIPHSIYWAIVTLTTVGYGDIAPQTDLGRLISSFVMILGYSILAVPTGIITSEILFSSKKNMAVSTQACPQCSLDGHDSDALYCKYCGSKL